MGSRSILKSLQEFASQELEEKQADRVHVRRVKMKSAMRRGRLPDMRIKIVEGAHYLVCVFHDEELRVYCMDKHGRMMKAENFSGIEKEKVWKDISQRTKDVFRLSN